MLDDALKFYFDLHQHPELAGDEKRTAAQFAGRLSQCGLTVTSGIGGHGVLGVLRNGDGPAVLLRAELDALPVTEQTGLPFASNVTTQFAGQTTGVMHACGHDAHTAILLGVADALVAMRDRLPGSVMLVFQPSEEGAPPGEEGGAGLMMKQGIFKDTPPEAVFGLHVFAGIPAGTIGYHAGPMLANVDTLSVTI